MKKQIVTAFFLLCLLPLSMLLPARADVIWEPMDDFYASHADECSYLDAVYVVPEGSSVPFYDTPELGSHLADLEAGTRVYVGFALEWEGALWGAGSPYGLDLPEGWLCLDLMEKEYNSRDFIADHEGELTEYQGELDGYQVENMLLFWTYPGSGIQEIGVGDLERDLVLDFVYTDPDGGRWGYTSYWYGISGWVYLDDPETEEAPVFPPAGEGAEEPETAPDAETDEDGIPEDPTSDAETEHSDPGTETEPENTPSADTGTEDSSRSAGSEPVILIVLLVAGVSIVTAILIFRRRK